MNKPALLAIKAFFIGCIMFWAISFALLNVHAENPSQGISAPADKAGQ